MAKSAFKKLHLRQDGNFVPEYILELRSGNYFRSLGDKIFVLSKDIQGKDIICKSQGFPLGEYLKNPFGNPRYWLEFMCLEVLIKAEEIDNRDEIYSTKQGSDTFSKFINKLILNYELGLRSELDDETMRVYYVSKEHLIRIWNGVLIITEITKENTLGSDIIRASTYNRGKPISLDILRTALYPVLEVNKQNFLSLYEEMMVQGNIDIQKRMLDSFWRLSMFEGTILEYYQVYLEAIKNPYEFFEEKDIDTNGLEECLSRLQWAISYSVSKYLNRKDRKKSNESTEINEISKSSESNEINGTIENNKLDDNSILIGLNKNYNIANNRLKLLLS